MYELNCDEDSIIVKGSLESNEELWNQKIKAIRLLGVKKKDKEYDLKEFCSELENNRINYGILKEHFEKIGVIGIVLNSFSGVANDELSSVCKEVIENTDAVIASVSLDSRSYDSDSILYIEGEVVLDIDGNTLEIKEGEIKFNGDIFTLENMKDKDMTKGNNDLKDMVEYLNEVEKFLLPKNREAFHQIKSCVQENARKR